MASENQGRDNTLPDSAALWNGGDGFAFPPLHSEASHSGIRDSDPLSFLQLQVSPSPSGTFHGEPAHYVGHASVGSLSSMMSNVTQGNNLLKSSVHDPLIPGGVFQAETNDGTSFSALNRRQSYDLNHNVQIHEVPHGISSNLQLDINRSPINVGGELGILRYGPDNWVMPGTPQLDTSKLDGNFLSLGHKDSASSRWESYASSGDYSGSRLPFPPFRQEAPHGPFNPVQYGACGSDSQNLVPSGTVGCFTLSHNDNGTLPGLTSGFDVSPCLPSSGQLIGVNQLMAAANGRSPVMGNHMNSRYNDTRYRTIPSGLYSNSQLKTSESGRSWMSRSPSEAVTTSSRQQSTAENHGIHLTSNAVFPLESPTYSPTLGTSSRKDQPDQASQERIMHAPPSESYNVISIASDQAVSASSRSKHIHDSNVECKSSLKRVPPTYTSAPPRKLIRQHTVGPSRFHVNPSQPQNSVLNIANVNPSTSATFTNISQQLIHPSFPSPKTAPHQNTSGNMVPAFAPFADDPFYINVHPKTIPAPQQISLSKTSNSYPNSSPIFTNTTQPPFHPSLVPQAQTAHLQKVSASIPQAFYRASVTSPMQTAVTSPMQTAMPQPFYRPSVTSPKQTAKPLNPLERRTPDFGASTNVSCSSTANFPMAAPRPSIAPLHGAAMGKPWPVFGATGNSFPRSNHTAQGSLAISAKKMPTTPVASGKALAPGSSKKTASTERDHRLTKTYSSVVQRFIERQTNALAAFEKKSPALASSAKTASMPHIKWQGLDKPEASGLKCLLCKGDLAYTPQGRVPIPAIAPEVAVLPCGHVFHDHCLVAITPQDQRTNPPCIPCSMGEPCA